MFERSVDISFVSETKSSNLDANQSIPGYVNFFKKCSKSFSGGVALFVKSNFRYTLIKELEDNEVDALFVSVVFRSLKILFVSVYIPPNDARTLNKFLGIIVDALTRLSDFGCDELCILGDLNARHPSWYDHTSNKLGKTLLERLNNSNLTVTNIHHESTFLCNEGSSSIDLVISTHTCANLITNQFTDNSVELFSGAPQRGHIPVFTDLKISRDTLPYSITHKYNWQSVNWPYLSGIVEQHLLPYIYTFVLESDPTILWSWFCNLMKAINCSYVPLKRRSSHNKPFWNEQLGILSKQVREARKAFSFRSNDINRIKLEECKFKFKVAIKSAQAEFLKSKCTHINNSSGKTFWNQYNKLIKPHSNTYIGNIKNNSGYPIISDEDKSSAFYNNIFRGKHLDDSILDRDWLNLVERTPIEEFKNINSTPFAPESEALNQPISLTELCSALKSSRSSDGNADPDEVHPNMIKYAGPTLKLFFLHLFNTILKCNAWPWKYGKVIFLPKSGKDPTSINSFRPITLTSVVGKLLERILESRLRRHVEENSILPVSQHGFRKGFSCETYLYNLISYIQHHKSSRHKQVSIFIDFQKAFDSVWLKGLLFRLCEIGVPTQMLHLFSNFLCGRSITISVNSYTSPALPHIIGVPQGSVLSPLFFAIYIRDMTKDISSNSMSLQYADDSTLCISTKTDHELSLEINATLNTIQNWCNKWRLNINTSKTKLMFFSSPPVENFFLNGTMLNTCQSINVLGLLIDNKLSFADHRSLATTNMQRKWGVLSKFFSFFTPKTMKQILLASILPSGFYCSHLWDLDNSLSQYQYIKDILHTPYNPPSHYVHAASQILPTQFLNTKGRLNLTRRLLVKNLFPVEHKNSILVKLSISEVGKLKNDRSVVISSLNPSDLKSSLIKKHVYSLWLKSWLKFSQQQSYGPIYLDDNHPALLFNNPINLSIARDNIGSLCALLSGHGRLQEHQYKLGIAEPNSPLCLCLQADESAQHFLNECVLNKDARNKHKPTIGNWLSLIKYIDDCWHQP